MQEYTNSDDSWYSLLKNEGAGCDAYLWWFSASWLIGSRSYLIKQVGPLDQPLDVLIQLEDFGLANGGVVTCEAQPGKPFQFIDGKALPTAR